MRVVIHTAGVKSEEAVEAEFARIRSVLVSQVPFPDQARRVAVLLQHAGDSGPVWLKKAAINRYADAIGPASGEQRGARRGAHGRICIPVGEACSGGRQAIEIRCSQIARTLATQVGVAVIVGENHDEVGGPALRLRGKHCRAGSSQETTPAASY